MRKGSLGIVATGAGFRYPPKEAAWLPLNLSAIEAKYLTPARRAVRELAA